VVGRGTVMNDVARATRPSAVSWELEREVCAFLHYEAELLDERRFDEWIDLLDDSLRYRMPVRATRPDRQGSEFSEEMYHFDDTKLTLKMRVDRLNSGDAWAEVPPSRTRHFVTNIRVAAVADAGSIGVRSNLLLARTRGDEAVYQWLTSERRDVLRRVEGDWRLAERMILLDATTLPTYNLAFFL
jgi:3-phenylpropionate/cinnamic acid dioxygenase small subunit